MKIFKMLFGTVLSFTIMFTSISFVSAATSSWKDAYINFINSSLKEDWGGYALINVNGDAIPELYLMGNSTAQGDIICTYSNGEVVTQSGWVYGTSYVKSKNLINLTGGHMDEYFDYIYKIENGQFVMIHKGEYGAADNSKVQFDYNGNPIYNYYWDGQSVTKSEYNSFLNIAYNQYSPIFACDHTASAYVAINTIKNYRDPSEISIILDGRNLLFNEAPYITNGTTMVPMRVIFEALGADVDYNSSTKTITAYKNGKVVVFTIGSKTAYINGVSETMPEMAVNINGTTMIPLRFVTEALGANVDYNKVTKTITIY